MNRNRLLLIAFALGLVGGITAQVVAPGYRDVVILGVALIGSELFELRPPKRAALPLSFAVAVVLVLAATPTQYALVIGLGYVVATAIRPGPMGPSQRLLLFAERLAEGYAIRSAYRLVVDATGHSQTRALVLAALAAAALAPVVVADLVTLVRERRIAPLNRRGADVALVTSAILMGVGYSGIHGTGRLGLWGPLLFSIPLAAAWYSLELLATTRRSFRQTVSALGAAPELGGLVRAGHVERVAELAVAMGRDLDLSGGELEQLETASLLHHLGAVCLDDPGPDSSLDPIEVARSGAAMLRASPVLAPAGDIVAAEPSLHRRSPGAAEAETAALEGQILKVASAFDELTEGQEEHAAWAVEALYTGPGYVYDGRVLGALERVLARRGLLLAEV